ncbi:MAG: 6-bladed beta-propeller [Nitrososphaerales archaeon]
MKIQFAAIILTILLASIFTSSQSVALAASYTNQHTLTVQLDKDAYLRGEVVKLSGTATPLKDEAKVMIAVLDPASNVRLAAEIPLEPDEDGNGLYSYEIELGRDAPVGLWTISVRYVSEYMFYDRTNLAFRVSGSIDVLRSPFLQVGIDGSIDSSNGEWADRYDSKYWRPFGHDPSKIEGNVAFNAYYVNGVLYALFDVPDKRFDSTDFVEIGLDLDNVGEDFKIGNDVYVFRVFRDGTHDSFRLGTEYMNGDRVERHHFSARAEEAGDIRMQVFDENGSLVRVLDSLRDKTSTSYKGMLGIAGIEIDSSGNLYVLDSDSGMVSKFNSEGNLLGSFGSIGTDFKEFVDPTGIALGPDGNIYVADTGNARVQKFDGQGKFVGAFGSMGSLSVGMVGALDDGSSEEKKRHDLFESPNGIVVDPSGNLYVVDRRAGSVNVFDSSGEHVKSFGSLVNPKTIAIDAQGNLYVVEQGNNRVVKFDQDGQILKKWGGFGIDNGTFKAPEGIAIDSGGNVYVADSINNWIQIFDSEGVFVAKLGTKGIGQGEFLSPHGLAIDSSDTLYVADTGNDRIQKLGTDGTFLGEFGSSGSEQGSFSKPEAVAIDSEGNIYVTDFLNKRVQKFRSDGSFAAAWGTEGSGPEEFRGPSGITVDADGSVYVADPFNRTVQRFDTDGNLGLIMGSGEMRKPVQIEEIPRGDHYVALDTNSHEPVGVVDADLVKEQGKGAYILESGKTWKIQHIFQDTIYVKPVEYARNPVLSWTPDGIDVDSHGNVFIVDRENEVTKKFGTDGGLIKKWGSTGSGDGEFTKPTAMAIDSENFVYIVDTGNNRIEKFDSEGVFVAKWGTAGQERGQFDDPRGIAIDGQNNVYVLDNGNNRVQKFDRYGKFITEWGSKGSSRGQFDNLSTEGIAVDSQNRVYVADLPGETKATHWIAEVAIPLYLDLERDDTLGIYLAQGMHGSKSGNEELPSNVRVYDTYRSTWPAGATSVLPATWAKAKIIDLEQVTNEPRVSIESTRVCTTDGDCTAELENAATRQVLTGSKVIVTASAALDQQAPEKLESERTKLTLQYSLDGLEWTDADTAYVQLSRDRPAAANLKLMPLDSGILMLRVTASGLLAKEVVSEVVNLDVLESESFRIRADLGWGPGKVVQGELVSFELGFAGAESRILEEMNYELRITKDREVVAELSSSNAGDETGAVFKHAFKETGLHLMQVHVLGLGSGDDFIPTKKVFNYRIDVLPVEKPIEVSSIQRGEAMKIIIKNHELSTIDLDLITLSLANMDEIDFRLPEGWSTSVNMKDESIQFSTEENPLRPGTAIEFLLKSDSLDSHYEICWELVQSSLVAKLC